MTSTSVRDGEFGAILHILRQRLDAVNDAIAGLEQLEALPQQHMVTSIDCVAAGSRPAA